jgi:hypothetical protein
MTLALVLSAWLIMIIMEIIIRLIKTRRPNLTGNGWRIFGFVIFIWLFLGYFEPADTIKSEFEFVGASFLLIFLFICTNRAIGPKENAE